uniref:PAS domain-containing protein n=1 Tax=Pyrodinium bahamense TaxID=73915 RepID=A0A7S0A9U7_9DINO|mmetsp:Transcript_28113/g.77394  ORF Transcript_28113/g.77394 Transcript_28113/m.77394 type:complete len:217 (+) Transcript_28113:54-704(+)
MSGEGEQDLQLHVDTILSRMNLDSMVVRSIRNCRFSVSIADPQLPDTPLIAVSEGFCELTGYSQEDVVGQNCRFLNEGCDLKMSDREGLRVASKTGRHFCALLPNRKADGTLFLNLLDIRGLAVGRTSAGEERWFLIGVQADMDQASVRGELPLERKMQMQHIAGIIREELVSHLQEVSLVTAESFNVDPTVDDITPYTEPRWIVGEVVELPVLGG